MLSKLVDMLEGLIKSRYYGTVEVKFEAGHIVLVKKTESIKLEEAPKKKVSV